MQKHWARYGKKLGIYGKLVVSFLIILGIPIIASAFYYSYTMNVVKRQSERMGQNILAMTRNDMDAQLEAARNFESRWFMDDNVREIADIQGEITRENSQTLLHLYQELVKQSTTQSMIRKAFLYFAGSDKIVSTDGNMDLEMYYNLYLKNEDLDCEGFRSLLKEHHQYHTPIFNAADGRKLPAMMLSLKNRRGEADAATIGLILDDEKLQKRLLSAESSESDVELAVLAESGTMLVPEQASFYLEDPDYHKFRSISQYRQNNQEGSLWITSAASKQTNWSYLMLTSSGAFAKDISRVQMIFIAGLFLSICTGFGLSWYLAGKNYNPFRKLADMLRTQVQEVPAEEGEVDELQWLSRQVEHILQKNVDTQKMLDKNKKYMREFYLWQLLSTDCEAEQLKRYGILFPYPCFLTTVLLIKPILQNEKQDERTAGLRRFIVHNIFAELAAEAYTAECFEFGERVVTIFNLPDDSQGISEKLHEMMERLQEMIHGPFHFEICGLIGAVHEGQGGIRASYKEAMELSEYLVTLDENIISVEDICGIEPKYEYLEDMEERLVHLISVGEQEKAEEVVREIFGKRLRGKVSLNLYRSLVYEIIGSLLKGASAAGYTNAASEIDLPRESVIKRSMRDTEEQLIAALQEICRKITDMRQATADNFNLSREIEAYIDENFADPDLNISITSQHFDRSPAYLSGIYKKQTGRSLLEYINMKRIACAEELLKNGASVVEAAEQSGFRDSGGFIRTFKRYRGITPGQLKTVKNQGK